MSTPKSGAEESGPPSLTHRFRALIVGVIIARGIAGLCATPLFEGWDEYQHVGYIVHLLENGTRPVVNQTEVPLSLIRALREFPQPEAGRLQISDDFRSPSYEGYWRGVPAPGATAPRVETTPADASSGGSGTRLYQAQHSWWYYAMVGPVFQALGGVDNLRLSVGGLRLVNLGFTAAAVWVALGVVASRVRNRRTAGWIAMAIGVQPLFLINGIRVASDAPGAFLAILAASQMMTLAIDDRRLIRRSSALGPLMGAAVLMKAANLALLLPLGVCWMIATLRLRPPVWKAAASAFAVALGAAATVGPELSHNLATYGVASSMQEAIQNHNDGRGARELLAALRDFPIVSYFHQLFVSGLFISSGWSFVGFPLRFARLHAQGVHLAMLGWCFPVVMLVARRLASPGRVGDERRSVERGWGGRTPTFDSVWTPVVCCLICASYGAALLYHSLQSQLAWGASSTGPWYAAPAIPWFLVVVVAGASLWPRLVATPIVAAILFSCLATEQGMIWNHMLPLFSGGAVGFEAMARVTSLQPWYLTTTSFILAEASAVVLLAAAILSIAMGPTKPPSRPTTPAPKTLVERRPRLLGGRASTPISLMTTSPAGSNGPSRNEPARRA